MKKIINPIIKTTSPALVMALFSDAFASCSYDHSFYDDNYQAPTCDDTPASAPFFSSNPRSLTFYSKPFALGKVCQEKVSFLIYKGIQNNNQYLPYK